MHENFKIRREDVKVGTWITCMLSSHAVDDGKIQIDNGIVYICQNVTSGDECFDKLGYNCSWSIGNYSLLEDGMDVDTFFARTSVCNVCVQIRDWDPEANSPPVKEVSHASPF